MYIKIVQDPANRNVYVQLNHITLNTIKGIRRAYYKIGKDLSKQAKAKILEGPKTGRIYYKTSMYLSKKTKHEKYMGVSVKVNTTSSFSRTESHQASKPGEYPANWTGKLRRSIDFLVRGSEQLIFGAETEYAKWLEDGTKNKDGTEKMAARSYLKRTIDETQGSAVQHFETEIKKALTQAGESDLA